MGTVPVSVGFSSAVFTFMPVPTNRSHSGAKLLRCTDPRSELPKNALFARQFSNVSTGICVGAGVAYRATTSLSGRGVPSTLAMMALGTICGTCSGCGVPPRGRYTMANAMATDTKLITNAGAVLAFFLLRLFLEFL